jgi:hypothetical protein
MDSQLAKLAQLDRGLELYPWDLSVTFCSYHLWSYHVVLLRPFEFC